MDIRAALPRADACPTTLRVALDAWQGNRLSNTELIEASYRAALDCLDDYAHRPDPMTPTAPEFAQYMAMTFQQRADMKPEAHRRFYDRFEGYFTALAKVRQQNASNAAWLRDVWTWAKSKAMPEAVMHAIAQVGDGHRVILYREPAAVDV